MFQRSCVQISAPYIGWTLHFFTLICCKNFNDFCLKRPKINEKEAGIAPFFKKVIWQASLFFYQKSHGQSPRNVGKGSDRASFTPFHSLFH